MGTPRRFLREHDKLWTNAAGTPIGVIEWTTRTREGAFFIRPTRLSSEIITGIMYRAREMYEVEIYSYAFLSNHAGILMGAPTHEQASSAMCYINGNIAKELSYPEFAGISGPFWHRRARAIPVITDYRLEERHRYHLANGTKEHLVARPELWPGAHAARPLCSGTPDTGRWVRRTKLNRLLQREKARVERNPNYRPIPLRELMDRCSEFYEFMPDRLPTHRSLSADEYRQYNRTVSRQIAADAARERAENQREREQMTAELQREEGRLISLRDERLPPKLRVMGKKKLQAVDPRSRPTNFVPSRPPMVHCDSIAQYAAYERAYYETTDAQKPFVTCVNRPRFIARERTITPYFRATTPVGVVPLPALNPAPPGTKRPP